MIIGFANGCFDILHEGHLFFLQACRSECDYLIVAVNDDKSVRRFKGPDRPIYPLEHRMAELQSRAGAYADAIVPFDGFEQSLIVSIKPAIVFRGYDQSADPTSGTTQVAQGVGCQVKKVDHLPGYSTSLQIAAARGKRTTQ